MNITWLGAAAIAVLLVCAVMGYRRGFVKEVVSIFLIALTLAIVSFINPYVNNFITKNTGLHQFVEKGCENFVDQKIDDSLSLGSGEQSQVIESLGLPSFLEDLLLKENIASEYEELGVSTFTGFVSNELADLAINALSFIISYILASLLLHMITYALDLMTKLPVIKGVNKLVGAALGIAKGLVIIGLVMITATILCNTSIGRQLLTLIEKDTFLNTLYRFIGTYALR